VRGCYTPRRKTENIAENPIAAIWSTSCRVERVVSSSEPRKVRAIRLKFPRAPHSGSESPNVEQCESIACNRFRAAPGRIQSRPACAPRGTLIKSEIRIRRIFGGLSFRRLNRPGLRTREDLAIRIKELTIAIGSARSGCRFVARFAPRRPSYGDTFLAFVT